MTICEPFYEGLNRRLTQKMTINQISQEMCRGVQDPRRKIIRIIKEYKGENYLFENSDWLGYAISNVRKTPTVSDAAKNCSADLARSKQIVSDIIPSVVLEATVDTNSVADKVVYALPKVDIIPSPKLEIQPKVEIDNLVGWTTINEQKIEISEQQNKKLDLLNTISETKIYPIDIFETPNIEILPLVDQLANKETLPMSEKAANIIKKNCIIGKNVLDCDICEFRMKYDDGKWGCGNTMEFTCSGPHCRYNSPKTCIECGFSTTQRSVYWAHIENLHMNNEKLMNEVKKDRLKYETEKKMEQINICPCGCGYGYKSTMYSSNDKWFNKDEIDKLKKILND